MGKKISVIAELRAFIQYFEQMKKKRPNALYLYSHQYKQYQKEVEKNVSEPNARMLTSFQGIPIVEIHNDDVTQ